MVDIDIAAPEIPGGAEYATARPSLFDPGQIGPVRLKNRLIMPPMTTRLADADGFVTDALIAYYARRAAGGVGLVTVEMSAPEPAGRHRRFELGISDDRYLPGLSRLVEAIHQRGAAASIQLGHGGGHTRIDVCGEQPIAPSAIPHVVQEGHTETIIPEEMTEARIEQTVQAFGTAALRAQRAGFDIVEIHAAHGYLLSQFFNQVENQRRDGFGGSLENRARIAIEITRRIRALAPRVGVIFRLNGDDYFPGGIEIAEAVQISAWAEAAGAHAIHVTGGHYRSLPSAAVMIPPMRWPDATFLHLAAAVKRRVGVPVVAVGRLGAPDVARRVLAEGKADFVGLGRPLLADPDWPARVAAGEPVRMCIACNTCVDSMRQGQPLRCLVNPEAGREYAADAARPAGGGSGLRIAVIGAGPAGLTFASAAAEQNRVTVFERSGQCGGSFLLAGEAPKFQEVDANPANLRRFIGGLEKQCVQRRVEFAFHADPSAHPELLEGFDLIVLAVGARYRWMTGGFVGWALRHRLLHLPLLRGMASSPRIRNWFYYQARLSRAEELRKSLQRIAPVIIIGDALKPGKSQEAILSAYEAFKGLSRT